MQLSGLRKKNILAIAAIAILLVVNIMPTEYAVLPPDLENALVILINGQSNAVSKPMTDQDCILYEDSKIVTFKNQQWYKANCDYTRLGFTGTVWLILAKRIVKRNESTVIILNGAEGGKPISHFSPDSENYKRFRKRIELSGVKPDVIIFYQGERDARIGTQATDWQRSFETIKSRWLIDYPTTTQFILVQVQPGCQIDLASVKKIMTAQASIGDVSIVETNDIEKRDDDCHLSKNGMVKLASRIDNVLETNKIY